MSNPLPGEVIAEGAIYDHEITEDGVTERRVATVRITHDPATLGAWTEYLAAPDDGSPEHLAELLADDSEETR